MTKVYTALFIVTGLAFAALVYGIVRSSSASRQCARVRGEKLKRAFFHTKHLGTRFKV